MSTAVRAAPPPVGQRARRPSLLRAEALRLRSRRLVRALLALGALALLTIVVVLSTRYAKPSAAGLAEATQARQEQVDLQRAARARCLADPQSHPAGVPAEQACGPAEVSPDEFGPVSQYVAKRPFSLIGDARGGVLGVAGAAAALAFLIGATYVGVEWSSRSMVALLFWEPRRPRVVLTKLAVLTGAVALLGVVAEAGWLLAARVLHGLRGDPAAPVPPHAWGDLYAGAGRGVVLVLLLGLLGFGVANLLRGTAAALGFGFVYFAIVESVVRALRPHWQPWLLTDNAVALLTKGGLRITYFDETAIDGRGFFQDSHVQVVGNLHGGLVLAVVAAVVVGLGVLVFTRRDLD